jgi:hypothetical protein
LNSSVYRARVAFVICIPFADCQLRDTFRGGKINLGPHIAVVEIGEMAPTGVWYQCGACQKKHRYELEEMRVEGSDLPPPPGWKSEW